MSRAEVPIVELEAYLLFYFFKLHLKELATLYTHLDVAIMKKCETPDYRLKCREHHENSATGPVCRFGLRLEFFISFPMIVSHF